MEGEVEGLGELGFVFIVSWDSEGACSGYRASAGSRAAIVLRGDMLRLLRRIDPLGECRLGEWRLPFEMPCRQVMMRSLGGCVDALSRLERLVRESMLLGRPIFEAESHSRIRRRLLKAQSCRNTLSDPV